MSKGWIGVDLDGTLAYYDKWRGADHIGEPIKPLLKRVKEVIAAGSTVKIFTARASEKENIPHIKAWCKKHGLGDLEVTNVKDFAMTELWDDRAKQVIKNKGIFIEDAIPEM
jgi:hypothetical protein